MVNWKNKEEVKEYNRKYMKNYYKIPKVKQKVKKYHKEYYQRPEVKLSIKEYKKEYSKNNPEQIKETNKRYKENNPGKIKARYYSSYYNQRKYYCELCNFYKILNNQYGIHIKPFLGDESELHFHHTDYIKNEGFTLCVIHHKELHNQINAEAIVG